MELSGKWQLEIQINTPSESIIDEIVDVSYTVKNISQVEFPGGTIFTQMSWPSLGPSPFVNQKMEIKPLKPNEPQEFSFKEKSIAPGVTIFTRPGIMYYANDKIEIDLYFSDERPLKDRLIHGEQLIGTFRVKTHEEINQAIALKLQGREVRIALIAFITLIIFQIIDWLFRYYHIL